jgi:AraC-like DNA-binding protein
MAVLLDTDGLPRAERADAVMSAMHDSFLSSYVGPRGNGDAVSARMDEWTFGTTSLCQSAMRGIQVGRTAKQVRSCPSPMIAIAVQGNGECAFSRDEEQHVLSTGQLLVYDKNTPYEFGWTGRGTSLCLYVPLDDLGMSHDVVREACTRLHLSPLYQLVVDHIAGLGRNAAALATDPAAAGLGTVSVELVRALVASAAHDARHRREALATTLLTQIRAYVRQHLSDPDLTPEVIAAVHHISVRHLYKVCAAADFSLHQWITAHRLQGAHDELAGTTSQHRSIAMIAQRWGFSNPTHFSRRFRDAYGITPRDWRRMAGQGEQSPSVGDDVQCPVVE